MQPDRSTQISNALLNLEHNMGIFILLIQSCWFIETSRWFWMPQLHDQQQYQALKTVPSWSLWTCADGLVSYCRILLESKPFGFCLTLNCGWRYTFPDVFQTTSQCRFSRAALLSFSFIKQVSNKHGLCIPPLCTICTCCVSSAPLDKPPFCLSWSEFILSLQPP